MAYGARLESVSGASPREFESRTLRSKGGALGGVSRSVGRPAAVSKTVRERKLPCGFKSHSLRGFIAGQQLSRFERFPDKETDSGSIPLWPTTRRRSSAGQSTGLIIREVEGSSPSAATRRKRPAGSIAPPSRPGRAGPGKRLAAHARRPQATAGHGRLPWQGNPARDSAAGR